MGLKDRLRKLERSTEGEAVLALCLECGEEARIRQGILLDLAVLDWQMHQDDTDELPADTPQDIRWVWEHPHAGLSLVEKYTREPVFGHKWAEAARMMETGAMGLRRRVQRLERAVEDKMIVIAQKDGTVRRFPPGAGEDAFMNFMDRLGAGEDAPPEHPLIEAARNSSDPEWSRTFFAVEDPERWIRPIPDLSE